MANWTLPLGEMKEIVSTIARRAGLDDELLNTLWKYIERMPEALQSAWINSFGDVSSPGLADARRRVLIARFKNDFPYATDEQAAPTSPGYDRSRIGIRRTVWRRPYQAS